LTKYLQQLKERELVEERTNSDGVTYALTDKGIRFLGEYRRISGFAEAFGFVI
jgi:predicted transcriptional regulator